MIETTIIGADFAMVPFDQHGKPGSNKSAEDISSAGFFKLMAKDKDTGQVFWITFDRSSAHDLGTQCPRTVAPVAVGKVPARAVGLSTA